MEAHVKQRITGAIVLVVLIVIFVPALLSGPRHTSARPTGEPGQPALQTYQSDLRSGSGATPALVTPPPLAAPIDPSPVSAPPVGSSPASAARLAPPRANADDAVASVTAGSDPDPTPERPAAPVAKSNPPSGTAAPSARTAAAKPASKAEPKPVTKAEAKPVAKAEPKPATKQATKAEPPPAKASGAWAVQVGGFSNQPNAQRLVEELRRQGFAAYIAQAGSGSRTLFRVRAGPVRDRPAAEALLKRLKAKGHSGSLVTNP